MTPSPVVLRHIRQFGSSTFANLRTLMNEKQSLFMNETTEADFIMSVKKGDGDLKGVGKQL
jgi:hypothetical protein